MPLVLIKEDGSGKVDANSYAALTGTLSITFDKNDRRPVIPHVAQAMLSKLGDYMRAHAGMVRLIRT